MTKARVSTTALSLMMLGMGACSDRSGMKLYIDGLAGTGANDAKPYIESDLIGNFSSDPCSVIQDQVKVDLRLDASGQLGPQLNAHIDSCEIQYYYYDPNTGLLGGPVSSLSVTYNNIRTSILAGGTASFQVAGVTFNCKAWSSNTTCHGIAGFPGARRVDRMILKVIVHGSDDSGKAMSSEGNIMVYLYDYGPGPTTPPPWTPQNWCFGLSVPAYWSNCF